MPNVKENRTIREKKWRENGTRKNKYLPEAFNILQSPPRAKTAFKVVFISL
jgi:hypothetical protein